MNDIIFADQNEVPLILSVTANEGVKQITVIFPRLPLPWGYGSIRVFPAGNGVEIRAAGSGKRLCGLPCIEEEVEQLWSCLLPLFSQAYVAGESDARDALACAITAFFGQTEAA